MRISQDTINTIGMYVFVGGMLWCIVIQPFLNTISGVKVPKIGKKKQAEGKDKEESE